MAESMAMGQQPQAKPVGESLVRVQLRTLGVVEAIFEAALSPQGQLQAPDWEVQQCRLKLFSDLKQNHCLLREVPEL